MNNLDHRLATTLVVDTPDPITAAAAPAVLPTARRQWISRTTRTFLMGLGHGALLMFLAFNLMFWHYEDQIIQNIVQRADSTAGTLPVLDRVLNFNEVVHKLIDDRHNVLGLPRTGSFRETWFGAADTELVEGRSACGGYAMVLGRMLDVAGIPFRLGQMRCGDIWGCHVFVEAQVEGQWIALDPTFGVAFPFPDGRYASARDLLTRFDEVEPALPAIYDRQYRFEEVRYTNWSKIPLLLPAFRTITGWFIGARHAEELSLRSYVLNRYRMYFCGGLALYAGVLLLVWLVRRRTRAAVT